VKGPLWVKRKGTQATIFGGRVLQGEIESSCSNRNHFFLLQQSILRNELATNLDLTLSSVRADSWSDLVTHAHFFEEPETQKIPPSQLSVERLFATD